MKLFKRRYRIVTDRYLGYEVQHWSWLWPFWHQTNFSNTFGTVEAAERYARDHAIGAVKYLGAL